ncbi:MAG: hypothetical protein ABSA03_20280 [Streptosporangiaceae bacterium]|jgi:hypothetical protein
MEPTSGQRKAAFVVVVVALAGLGIFLLRPTASGAARPGAAPSASTHPPASTRPPAATSQPASTPTAAGPGRAGPASIYQWLPFTARDLASAAAVATRFGDLYDTFSYSEGAAGYVQQMRAVITAQLAAELARAYATPGVATPRTQQKQVSAGAASISSLRAFGSGSITFVVSISQKITERSGTSRNTTEYAVTVTGSGTSWQVNDIELASAGNT